VPSYLTCTHNDSTLPLCEWRSYLSSLSDAIPFRHQTTQVWRQLRAAQPASTHFKISEAKLVLRKRLSS
jgi:hypothetical protein